MAVFLAACKGYSLQDARAGWFAGLFAIGVAFFPTRHDKCVPKWQDIISAVHFFCAASLFLILTYFCLRLFTKTHENARPTDEKLQRNKVYIVCGYTMLACVVLAGITAIPLIKSFIETTLKWTNSLFWFESTAMIAFGVAWLTKGEKILPDKNKPPSPLFIEDHSMDVS